MQGDEHAPGMQSSQSSKSGGIKEAHLAYVDVVAR
jgi:hypothetical protein